MSSTYRMGYWADGPRKKWLYKPIQMNAAALWVAFVLPCVACFGDVSSVQVLEAWNARHAGQGNGKNFGSEMRVDREGKIYVTGESYRASNTKSALVTVRYSGSGSVDWTSLFNGPANGFNQPRAMALDGLGHIYLVGTLFTGLGGKSVFMTLKMTTNHALVWTALYDYGGVAGVHEAKAIAVDDYGNVYVSGVSAGLGGHSDFATIKYDSSGNQLWAARYNGPADGEEVVEGMVLDNAGNVYVTGTSEGGASGRDYATVKYETGGNQIWVARYDGVGSGDDEARGLGLDSVGNVYVTGTSFGGTASDDDYATVKYDSSGTQLWEARYDGPAGGGDYACALAVDGAGQAYVTGESTGGAAGYDDFITLKYDSNGTMEWVNRYSGSGGKQDVPTAIALDGAGKVYVTGESVGAGSGTDYATVAYDESGSQLWAVRFNGTGNEEDYPTALVVDGAGNVYVHGYSQGPSGEFDFATVKYTQSVTAGDLLITDPPADRNVLAGDEVTFSVGVDGIGPFAYQWQFNGTSLVAETNSTLVLSNVQAAAQGDYRVQVTSLWGSLISAQARLTVDSLPVIVTQPAHWPNLLIAGRARFFVTALGARPLSYQWLFEGMPMPGQTNPVLLLPSVQLSDSGDYRVIVSNQFNATTSQVAELTVVPPVPLSIAWSNPASIRYGTPLGSVQLSATANVLGSFLYDPPPGTILNVGNNQILRAVFTPDDMTLYEKATNTITLDVLRAPLTITANNTNKEYGAANPVFTASYSGLVNGDTPASLDTPVSLSSPATAGSPVGAYPIPASAVTDANYTISFVNGTLTVDPAPLTIAANSTNKLYGAAVPTLTASFTGFVNGDNAASLDQPVNLGTTAAVNSPAGSYPITPGGAADANYSISFVNGTLAVDRAPLTIAINNTNKIYGAALPAFTAVYVGFVNGDTPASLDPSLILKTTATPASSVGSYPITGNGAAVPSLASYAFDEGSGMVAGDGSGNGFDASIVGGVQWVQGHSGSAVSFDGVSGYAQAPSTSALNFGETNSFTIAAWVRSSPGYSTTSVLLSKQGDFTGPGFGLWNLNTPNSRLYARLVDIDGDQNGWLVNDNGPYINDGEWHHVAMVVDRAQQQAVLYTDEIKGRPYDLAAIGKDGIGDLSNAAAFTIGGSLHKYEGDIDEVRVYGVALSEQQVQSLSRGNAPFRSPLDSNYTISYVDGILTIDQAGTTGVLVSSANPALPGHEATFTLALVPLSPGIGTPTGIVQFRVDGSISTAAALSDGSAAYSTASLVPGTHTVVAEYAGDGNFSGTTNALAPQQVINTPPVAANDTIERYPTSGVNVELTTLLANDNDGDGDLLTITVSSLSAAGGTIIVDGDRAFYTPPFGHINSDSFTYVIADGYGEEATATVTVSIKEEPLQILTISHLGNGTYGLALTGVPGRSYTLQYTDELNPPNWQTLSSGAASSLGTLESVDTPPVGSRARFYRSLRQ